MTRRAERKGLGRGLSALLGDAGEGEVMLDDRPAEPDRDTPTSAPIEMLHPNPNQPRRDFSGPELEELAASIRKRGVIQPVIVRPDPIRPGDYQIVAGERRWRAAQRAQLHNVPVVVRDLDDRTVLEVALIENIQRADLNPVEEATGYKALIDAHSYTQENLAEIVGKSRSHLANTLRLLGLPDPVLAMLREGKLTAGHARALIGAPDPAALARTAVARQLTVRQLEALAQRRPGADSRRRRKRPMPEKDADTRLLEGDLSAAIGLRVSIDHSVSDGSGELRIRYRSLDDLDRVCRKLAE